MRTFGSLLFALLVGMLLAGPVSADEILLDSGARIRGTVEKEDADEVVIRTDIGLMTFPRKLVKEIHREKAPAEPTAVHPEISTRIDGIRSDVAPVAAGSLVLLADVSGGVRAVDPATGQATWHSPAGENAVTGIAADPGGAFVATANGILSRLHPGTGEAMWTTELPNAALRGAPILHRRGVFSFAPGVGLYGLDQADGKVRGLLTLKFDMDTPLASVGDRILVGDPEGRLVVVGDDGKKLMGIFESTVRWMGRPVAQSLRTVLLGGGETFVVFDPRQGKLVRRVSVPGLYAQPLGGDAGRAFVEIEGELTALDIQTGRILFRSPDAGRVTGLADTGKSLFATTADDRLVRVSPADGTVLWSIPIEGRAASRPLVIGDLVLVTNREGTCLVFAEKPGKAAKPVEERQPGAPSETGAGGVLHAPEGYRITVPEGWKLAEDTIRGEVSLGLRPDRGSPRFAGEGTTAEDLHRLSLTGHLTVAVLEGRPATGKTPAEAWLDGERVEASRGGYQVEPPKTRDVEHGGRTWSEVSVVLDIPGSPPRRVFKRAAFAPVDGDKMVRVELRIPEGHREAGEADFAALAASLAPESDFEPTPDVGVAVDVLAAVSEGDFKSIVDHLAEPVRERLEEGPPETDGARYRPLELQSSPVGRFREVRVRVDEQGSTRFASLLLAEEEGVYVVVGWRSLFRKGE